MSKIKGLYIRDIVLFHFKFIRFILIQFPIIYFYLNFIKYLNYKEPLYPIIVWIYYKMIGIFIILIYLKI